MLTDLVALDFLTFSVLIYRRCYYYEMKIRIGKGRIDGMKADLFHSSFSFLFFSFFHVLPFLWAPFVGVLFIHQAHGTPAEDELCQCAVRLGPGAASSK